MAWNQLDTRAWNLTAGAAVLATSACGPLLVPGDTDGGTDSAEDDDGTSTETSTETDPATAESFESVTFGRLTLVDLAVVRLWWPTARRVQPFLDVGGFVGGYRSPGSDSNAVGGGRFGLGFDAWLGPTFSLNFGIDERLIAIRNTIGHTLQFGFGATLHW